MLCHPCIHLKLYNTPRQNIALLRVIVELVLSLYYLAARQLLLQPPPSPCLPQHLV